MKMKEVIEVESIGVDKFRRHLDEISEEVPSPLLKILNKKPSTTETER